jgi:hypothetical protein
MVKYDNGVLEIATESADELVVEIATILVETKRQLRFKLGREAGDLFYQGMLITANKVN